MPVPDFSILDTTPVKTSLKEFPKARELAARLRKTVRGEVHFDAGSRALYATDASNYRQFPIGLVLPRDAVDVEAAIQACREFNAPVLARGAATSLAGQCCNTAVIIDFSKFMNRILSLDPGARTAVAEPGVVLDRLREAAEQHELTFAPDPATHSRCTLGGMIGNNSCGTHSLLGGKTVDNVEQMEVLLYALLTRRESGKVDQARRDEEKLSCLVSGRLESERYNPTDYAEGYKGDITCQKQRGDPQVLLP